MRFLADESCDFAVVRALRSCGHDVLAICEFSSGSPDVDVMEMAARDTRIILTEDKDFGWLALVRHLPSAGVILIRFPASARVGLGGAIVAMVDEVGDKLLEAFVVLRPGSVRVSSPRSKT